ncbi:MAG: hypothetical protein BroJett040_16210 [Oligoflexia bacterium]|nr:MAG: hypothetical protein BroJett040_16210 [Oligoflexia bacterium]
MSLTILFLILLAGFSVNTKPKTLEQIFENHQTPAFALRKIENDQITFDHAAGKRALNFSTPVTSQDKWHLGSCTKPMTSYLIGILIDQGKLNFNTSLSQILSDPLSDEVKNLTIQELLTHRSGLKHVSELKDDQAWDKLFDQNTPTKILRLNLVRTILAEVTKFSANSQFEYSNSNYIILGHVIETLFRKSWEEVMTEKIFKPLGMSHCGFGPPASRDLAPPDQPWGHLIHKGKLTPIQPLTNEKMISDNPAAFGPAGTVHCSLDSWSLFLKEMLSAAKGKSQLLTKATALHFFQLYKDGTVYGGWGGYHKSWSPGLTHTMVGTNTMNYARFYVSPEKNLILMGVTNSGTDLSQKALDEQLKRLAE